MSEDDIHLNVTNTASPKTNISVGSTCLWFRYIPITFNLIFYSSIVFFDIHLLKTWWITRRISFLHSFSFSPFLSLSPFLFSLFSSLSLILFLLLSSFVFNWLIIIYRKDLMYYSLKKLKSSSSKHFRSIKKSVKSTHDLYFHQK